jgi:aspartate racemase
MADHKDPGMKKIGLIGGLSPESTAHYYEIICREYNRNFGRLNFPEMTIESLNLQTLVERFDVNDWSGVASILLKALERLQGAGAQFAAILANTPHNAYELIRDQTPLPIVTIMDATAAELASDNRKKVGLLGTRPTMEYGFFQKHFQARGMDTLVPGESDRRELDRVIWEELSHGVIKPESRALARTMLDRLKNDGAEATVLGCTELCLLIKPKDSPIPLYDTTELHAKAILSFGLNDHLDDLSSGHD